MSACTGCGTEIGGPPSGLCFACWGEKILLDTRLRDKECADYRTITRQRDALLAGCKAASRHLHELALEQVKKHTRGATARAAREERREADRRNP